VQKRATGGLAEIGETRQLVPDSPDSLAAATPVDRVASPANDVNSSSTRWKDVRILEVGDRSLFAETFPQNTLQLWTGLHKIPPAPGRRNFGLAEAVMLLRALRSKAYDLIVCYPPPDKPLGIRTLFRLLGRKGLAVLPALFRGVASEFLRLPTNTPIAVLDTEDCGLVERHNFPLLFRCRTYFKRELPPDHWKAFVKTAHPHVPTARVRRSRAFREGVEKMRPFALGISEAKLCMIGEAEHDKTVDVFFAGALENSAVRETGVSQIRLLASQGYTVDIAGTDLSQEEYFARCSRAWLTWSPEGYGWDCFRHYEAAACRSVPIISQATIHRYEPLRHGVHCYYYDVEGDDLRTVIVNALADRRRLAMLACNARDHVLRHHTHLKLCEYVLETVLGG
jgi:hypothetical protein